MSVSDKYPQMTKGKAIEHCKHWGEAIRHDGIELLVSDYEAAVTLSDSLAYPLEMQKWITAESEPLLNEICAYAVVVDNDHTNRAAWEKLLELIDTLDPLP
ncbi:MAG: hypothetical protein WBP12_01410 [Candidatus Saccharimonas sp.]